MVQVIKMAKMAKRTTIHTPVKIENMDADFCSVIGGKVTSDGKCMVRTTVDERKPRQIEIEGISEDELKD